MNILVACEESQAVTIELRKLGHEAYSCDVQECSGGHPEWHIQSDVLPLLDGNCTFITVDGQTHTRGGHGMLLLRSHHVPTYQMQVQDTYIKIIPLMLRDTRRV